MIRIEYDGHEVLDHLRRLSARMDDMTPVMADIGEHLAETTKRRFDTSTGPDGKRWAPNSEVTILQYLGVYKGSYKKDGKLSAKGASRSAAKKPLIGDTRSLMSDIFYKLVGTSSVEIGSTMEYAAMQHFGGNISQFPNLWGNIPARPFLGVSDADERAILDIVSGYLSG